MYLWINNDLWAQRPVHARINTASRQQLSIPGRNNPYDILVELGQRSLTPYPLRRIALDFCHVHSKPLHHLFTDLMASCHIDGV